MSIRTSKFLKINTKTDKLMWIYIRYYTLPLKLESTVKLKKIVEFFPLLYLTIFTCDQFTLNKETPSAIRLRKGGIKLECGSTNVFLWPRCTDFVLSKCLSTPQHSPCNVPDLALNTWPSTGIVLLLMKCQQYWFTLGKRAEHCAALQW